MDDFKLVDAKGKTVAMGSREQMFSFVKHHVSDGRYRIVGSEMKIHVVRKDGIVAADADGVCLERATDFETAEGCVVGFE